VLFESGSHKRRGGTGVGQAAGDDIPLARQAPGTSLDDLDLLIA